MYYLFLVSSVSGIPTLQGLDKNTCHNNVTRADSPDHAPLQCDSIVLEGYMGILPPPSLFLLSRMGHAWNTCQTSTLCHASIKASDIPGYYGWKYDPHCIAV